MRVVWSEQAHQEWTAQYRFYFARNPEAARRMRTAVQRRTAWLKQHPRGGRPGHLEGTRELVIPGTPWLIVYQENAVQVEILHFYHGRQNWQQEMREETREDKPGPENGPEDEPENEPNP